MRIENLANLFLRLFILLSITTQMGCTNVNPQVSVMKTVDSFNFIKNEVISADLISVPLQASCSRFIQSVEVSFDGGTTWMNDKSYNPTTTDCNGGNYLITLSKNIVPWKNQVFFDGQVIPVKFRALSLMGFYIYRDINVKYSTSPIPGGVVRYIGVDPEIYQYMKDGRTQQTATRLNDGNVLVVGGVSASVTLSSAEIYNANNGIWSQVSPMSLSRMAHTATLLTSGKVLVVGGQSSSVVFASALAEIYDPVTNKWSAAAAMNAARAFHTATILSDGKVLVTGGQDSSSNALSTAEIYDPVMNTWSLVAPMSASRALHTATLLKDGRVFMAGGKGASSQVLNSAEIYTPSTNTWSSVLAMSQIRYAHTATGLNDGRVLVIGGQQNIQGTVLSSPEIYDPMINQWTSVFATSTPRYLHTATLLNNGKVLISGGQAATGAILNSAEIYDSTAGTWSAAAPLNIPRFNHTATLLFTGKVLIAGGAVSSNATSQKETSSELYDPISNSWTAPSTINNMQVFSSTTYLGNGKILLYGGMGLYGSISQAKVFSTVTGAWTAINSPDPQTRLAPSVTLLLNGNALIAGGVTSGAGSSPTPASQIYNPNNNIWTAGSAMITNRTFPATVLLPSGKVLATGGSDTSSGSPILASAEVYDPSVNTWMSVAPMSIARSSHTATLLPGGKVFVCGGSYASNSFLASAEIYDPIANTWTAASPMSVARASHTATLLSNGKVLVSGGSNTSTLPLSSAEIYDPALNTWTPVPSMNTARAAHVATLLLSGDVVVTGGVGVGGSSDILNAVEVYNFNTNLWTTRASAVIAREAHAAILLPDQRVFIFGGTTAQLSLRRFYETLQP